MHEEIEQLPELHVQIREFLDAFTEKVSFESRLALMQAGKKAVARYFKASYAFSTFLAETGKSNERIATVLRRFAADMESEGKKVVDVYLKYGSGCEKEQQLKFQIALAEAHALLVRRMKVEEKHLLPEYHTLMRQNH